MCQSSRYYFFVGLNPEVEQSPSKRGYYLCAELSEYDCARHLMGGWIRLMARQRSAYWTQLRVYPWISWCPTLHLISWCATLQFWLSLHKYSYLLGTCINFTWFSIPVTLSRHQYIKLYLHRITNFKISL